MRRLLFFVLGMMLISAQLLAQNRTITGKVTDAQGIPVSNASVSVKGTTTGTSTGADGSFSLSVPANAKTLVISSIGYQAQEIAIGSQSSISVSLVSANDQLTEVVVSVPYGTIKKKAFTGAEVTINARAIEKQQVTSVTNTLEGLVPGIITTNGGGAPGSSASILIRGFSSINGSSDPLYVLNGVPYDGSIASLSTDDIESVTILKDAAASALYGSRAAGGVIMITTKSGKKGKPVVAVNLRQGFMSRGIPEYDRIGPKEYYEIMWEATRNAFQFAQGQSAAAAGQNASNQLTDASHLVYNAYNVAGNQLVDPTTGKLNPNAKLLWNDSWEDLLYRNASRQNANFNVSGAGDRSDYYLSAGYLNEEGTMKFTNYKRYNLRANINTDATNWLRTGLDIDGAYSKNTGVLQTGSFTSNPFYYTRNMGPIYPVYQHNPTTGATLYDSTGKPVLDWGVPTQMGARPYATNSNLLGSLALDERSSKIFNGNANTYAEAKILKSLSFKTTFGLNLWENDATTYQNRDFGDAQNVQGRLTKSFERQISYTFNQVLTWDKNFGVHNVRALVGHENYNYKDASQSATKTGFQFAEPITLATASTTEGTPDSREDNETIESYFANVNYAYGQKYLASASVRRDGSSRFADSVRWGNFYSAGIGWRISQEDFLKNVSWINELKIRASYGEVGQSNLGLGYLYSYRNYYNFDGFGNYTPSNTLANPSLHWEKNKKSNVGVDFLLFKNRLQGTVEYFHNASTDLLFLVPLGGTSAPSNYVPMNIGSSTNKGIELQLGYGIITGKDFNWRADLNLTHLKNVVTKLPPTQTTKGIVVGTKKISIGHSIYDFWLREFAGVDASNGDALYYKDVLDANGKVTSKVVTNNINQASYYYFGSAIPDVNGGLTNSFRYKNFNLSVLVTFAYGGKFYDGNYAGLMSATGYGNALSTDILNRWQKPGDVTIVPRVQNAIANQEGQSNRFLFDGSYANIKNVTLGYNLGKQLAERMHVSSLSVFGTVDNAYLFTAKKGMDPQRSFNGTSDASYPPFRTITFGLSLNL
jgi:TonB-linked SusC/RagA family outer membrane protein